MEYRPVNEVQDYRSAIGAARERETTGPRCLHRHPYPSRHITGFESWLSEGIPMARTGSSEHTVSQATSRHCCHRMTRRQLWPLLLLLALSAATTQAQSQVGPGLPTLTRLEQIRLMTPEEAGRSYPVRIRGVITYYCWETGDLFVQDSTAGIYVDPGPTKLDFHAGEFVEVKGLSASGDLAPEIHRAQIQNLGEAPLPASRLVSSDELASGKQDSQWIEVEALVRSAAEREGRLVLNVSAGTFEFRAIILNYRPLSTDLVDARIRIRGVLGGIYTSKQQLVGFLVTNKKV